MDEATLKLLETKLTESVNGAFEKHIPGMLNDAVGKKIDAEFKRLGIDEKAIKDGMFPGHAKPAVDAKEAKERQVRFIKSIFRKDMAELANLGVKAMSEGTDSAGGFLVPEDVSNEIDRLVSNYGLLRNLARPIPMKRDSLVISNLATAPSVYWPGEGANGTESSPVLRGVKLEAKSCVGLTVCSNEFLADATIDTVNFLFEILAEEIAGAEDSQGLVGTGSPFTGIMASADVAAAIAATGHDTFAEVDLDDYSSAISSLKESALQNASWVMSRTVWGLVRALKENSQHITAIQIPQDLVSMPTRAGILKPQGYLWGLPVYTSDKMPASSASAAATKMAILGDFKHFYFGKRQEMAMEVSREATVGSVNAFQSNQSVVRVVNRVGLNFNPDAFVTVKTIA